MKVAAKRISRQLVVGLKDTSDGILMMSEQRERRGGNQVRVQVQVAGAEMLVGGVYSSRVDGRGVAFGL